VGFCLGGRYGLLLAAKDRRIAACLPYYPTIETPPLPGQDEDVVALAATIACPVHMVRAGKDHLTSEDVFRRLQATLQRRSAPTTIQVYPDGDHGFMQRTGAANETAIRLSTAQAIAFLTVALGA
jgi:carboxymethylenebutenolidase